jgi:hypothetical protein
MQTKEWNHNSVLGGGEWPDWHPISFKPGEGVFVAFDYEAGGGGGLKFLSENSDVQNNILTLQRIEP